MTYTLLSLEDKLLEMYPEIHQNEVKMKLRFEEDKDAWLISLDKDGRHLETHLNNADAEACLQGRICVSLGVKVGEFMDNFTR